MVRYLPVFSISSKLGQKIKMILSDNQLDFIIEKLKATGLSYQPLEEEMIDHFACLIEVQMEKGYPFFDAIHHVFGEMEEKDLFAIETETITLLTYKSTTMQKVSRLMAACAALLFGLFIYYTPILPDEKEYADNAIFMDVEASLAASDNVFQNDPPNRNNQKKVTIPSPVFVHQFDPPSRSPLDEKPKVTSGFGMRFHPIFKERKMHRGIDLRAERGTPVYATADGVVEKAVTHNKYGKMIVLKHDSTYQTLYSQLSAFEVKIGMEVKKGDLIGRVGSSGLSTAPHLHYEVLKDGKAVNPEKYF